MLKKILSNNKKVSNITTFLSAFIVATSLMGINSNAANYYVRSVLDEGSFGVITQIISDKFDSIAESSERKNDMNYSEIIDYSKVYKGSSGTPGSSLIANIVTKDAAEYAKLQTGQEENGENMGLVYTFPGITNQVDTDVKYIGGSADAARAELVGNTITKGLNDALSFIKTYSKAQHVGGDSLRIVLTQLARTTSQFPGKKTSETFSTGGANGAKSFNIYYIADENSEIRIETGGLKKTVTVSKDLIPVNKLDYSDYALIATTAQIDGKNQIVYGYYPWRMEKGYHEGGAMSTYVDDKYKAAVAAKKENKYLTWGHLIIQAGANADVKGTTSAGEAEDTMTLIGQGLGADLTSTINSVRSLLNLAPIQELILNMGSRNVTHHLGVMTDDMYNTAKSIYTIVLAVSLLALGALIVKMIHQKMISTTNIIARTSLMEGLQDVVFVGVMLAAFPSIFELLLELNYGIVSTFAFSNDYLQAYGISGAKVLGMETLAGFMVSSMFLSIDAYINVTYLVRAIVVSFLFAIAPVMTISYAWGPMQKKLYFGYMRELVGNIFMQSFHAITMSFFAGYNATNMSAMEAIASTYCFIPITQLFRSLVIGGAQGGFSEQIGGKLAGQLTNTATGLHKSAIAQKQANALNTQNAENAKILADATFKSQVASMTGDLMGRGISSFANSEMGRGFMGGAKSSTASKIGAAGEMFMNLAGAGMAGQQMKNAHEEANQNLGKMQMEHSMENIGVGLAQAGIGLGVSSFDTGAGSAMIGAGMGSVERASASYGQGQSLKGEGGSIMAEAKGKETEAFLGARAVGASLANYGRNSRYAQEADRKAAMQEKLDRDRGIDVDGNYNNTTRNYLNLRSSSTDGEFNSDKGVNTFIDKIETHDNNNDNISFYYCLDL